MFNISIVVVGKLKESWWREAQEEYLRRLKPYAKISLVEVNSEPITDTADATSSMSEEGRRLLRHLPESARVIALERTGNQMPSEGLADYINKEGASGRKLCLIVGGAAGLDREVLARADLKLSLSKMTFTHEMARILILEQIYRAATIIARKKYHY
jgi:23S rRNA (pseudouridine1915-N3)-methyltransferase